MVQRRFRSSLNLSFCAYRGEAARLFTYYGLLTLKQISKGSIPSRFALWHVGILRLQYIVTPKILFLLDEVAWYLTRLPYYGAAGIVHNLFWL